MTLPLEFFTVSARIASMQDDGAFLGTRLSPAFGLRGGSGVEAGGALDMAVAGAKLRFAALGGRYVPDIASGGLFNEAGSLVMTSWSVSGAIPVSAGELRLHLSQPPAIRSGGFLLAAGGDAHFVPASAASPERTLEANYRAGPVEIALFQRFNAGHVAGTDDSGLALQFGTSF